MTNRDFVSQVRSMSKLLSSDQMITDRTILHEGKTASNLIIHQSMNQRKLWQSPNVFAFFPCLEMETVPITECCDYTSDRQIAKSIKQLPTIGDTQFGLAIQGVFNIDNSLKFKYKTPSSYVNSLRLGLKTKDVYFWILNNHLYVSNPDTKAVNMFAYPAEPILDNSLLYPGEDCDCMKKPDIESLCQNPLDQPFYAPADRINDIKNIVYQNLLKTYFNVPKDRTANQNDETSR